MKKYNDIKIIIFYFYFVVSTIIVHGYTTSTSLPTVHNNHNRINRKKQQISLYSSSSSFDNINNYNNNDVSTSSTSLSSKISISIRRIRQQQHRQLSLSSSLSMLQRHHHQHVEHHHHPSLSKQKSKKKKESSSSSIVTNQHFLSLHNNDHEIIITNNENMNNNNRFITNIRKITSHMKKKYQILLSSFMLSLSSLSFISQLLITLFLYIFHLIVLTQNHFVFPIQLLPFMSQYYYYGTSIGYDTLAGIIIIISYITCYRNQLKQKQNEQQSNEQTHEQRRTLPSLFSTPSKDDAPWNLPSNQQQQLQIQPQSDDVLSTMIPVISGEQQQEHQHNDSILSTQTLATSTIISPRIISADDTMKATSATTTSTTIMSNQNTNINEVSNNNTNIQTIGVVPNIEKILKIFKSDIIPLIQKYTIPSYILFRISFIISSILLAITYFSTSKMTLFWEDFIYTASSIGFPITIPLQRSLLVLTGHLSWVITGSIILLLLPRPSFFSHNIWSRTNRQENDQQQTQQTQQTQQLQQSQQPQQELWKWFTVRLGLRNNQSNNNNNNKTNNNTIWVWWTIGGYYVSHLFFIIADVLNQILLPMDVISTNNVVESVVTQLVNPEYNDFLASLIGYIAPCISAPIWEELLYRGYLLSGLITLFGITTTRINTTTTSISTNNTTSTSSTTVTANTNNKNISNRGYHIACIIQAIIFSAHHMSINAFIPLAVLGYLWSVIYTKSQNLLTVILIHAMWNSRVFLGSWLGL